MSNDSLSTSTHPTRAQEAREEEWKEPNELDVPDTVLAKLKSEGCEPRWIRVLLSGDVDRKNIATKLREGYQFVTASSVGDLWADAPEQKLGTYGNLILVGDLALAKLPISISKSRKRQMFEKAHALTKAIDQQLRENSALNAVMPIQNTSRSQVFRGRNVQVDD